MAFYVFFNIMPKTVAFVGQWNFYFVGGLFIGLCGIVYSYFHDFTVYQQIFSSQTSTVAQEITSFTNNKNTFGTLLLISVCCSEYLYYSTRKYVFKYLTIFVLIHLLLCGSKSSLFCALLLLVYDFIKDIFLGFKAANRKAIIFTCVSLAILVFLAIFAFSFQNSFPFIKKSLYWASELFSASTLDSLSGRVAYWETCITVWTSSPLSFLFGIGDWNFSWYFGFYYSAGPAYIESAHSGFFDIACRLGLFGLIVWLLLLVYFVVCLAKNKRDKIANFDIQLLLFLVVILHGLFEDTNFLNMQAKDMMLLFVVFMPVLTNCRLSKTSKGDEWVDEYSSGVSYFVNHPFSPIKNMDLCCFAGLPICGIAIGLSRFFSTWNNLLVFENVCFQIQISLIFVFLPLMVYALSLRKQQNKGFIFSIQFSFVLLWVLGCLVVSSFSRGLVASLILLCSGVLITFFGFFNLRGKKLKSCFASWATYLLIEVVLIATSQLVTAIFLIPDRIYQPYASMCLIIFDFIFPFLLIIASPLHKIFAISLDNSWHHVEDSYRFIVYRCQVKREISLMQAVQRKPVLRNQK